MLMFASAKDLAGTGECDLELPEGSKTSDLRVALEKKFILLREVVSDVALAINQEYISTDDDPVLHDRDEVALIPPISGG